MSTKTNNPFKAAIQAHLEQRAKDDQLFAETLKKPNKNIDDCYTYILNQVKKSGREGFTDEEIFGMAVHFYDEDDLKAGPKVSAKVIVNHQVDLSEEDKNKAYEVALERATAEKAEELKKGLKLKVKLTPEELAEAKQLAMDAVVAAAKEKLKSKPVKKQEEVYTPATLF